MATTNFLIKGTKIPSPIYARFSEGNSIDIFAKTGIFVNPKFWDKSNKKIRNVLDVPNRNEINQGLDNLKNFISNEFNGAYISGEILNRVWLEGIIHKFFNRPKEEEKLVNLVRNIYLTDFAQNWIEVKAPKYKVSSSKFMTEQTISHYQQTISNLIKFEGKKKIELRSITSEFLDEFSNFLSVAEGYSSTTTKRKLGRVKFFCERAEADNLEVNKSYKTRVFVKENEVKYKEPYFNEAEIEKIFKVDLSFDKNLDVVRDNLLISIYTGLRISDIQRLDIADFKDGYINIRTMKTNSFVTLPIHSNIQHILDKRKGNLPRKVATQKFNSQIKVLARLLEFDNKMIGGIIQVGADGKKRKVIGLYEKWQLVSTHICRRSFLTLHYGKIPDKVLMDLLGWSSPAMLLHYNKQTTNESADILKDFWEKQI
jgi:integrase